MRRLTERIEPPCWERLDNALQLDGLLRVGVDRRLRHCNTGKPIVWGDWHPVERSDEWLAEARDRFPNVCKSGRLWAQDAHREWHHMQLCEFSALFRSISSMLILANENFVFYFKLVVTWGHHKSADGTHWISTCITSSHA